MEQDNSMTDIEYNAFIEHLKSSEIYKKVQLRKGFLDEEPSQDSMAWDDWERSPNYENPEKLFVGKNGQTYWFMKPKKLKLRAILMVRQGGFQNDVDLH